MPFVLFSKIAVARTTLTLFIGFSLPASHQLVSSLFKVKTNPQECASCSLIRYKSLLAQRIVKNMYNKKPESF